VETFHTWAGFVKALNENFGDIDQKRTAVLGLQGLKQKGSVITYTQHALRVNFNDEALYKQYYVGLKDMVKDEIARSVKPTTLRGLIDMATQIDNRTYGRIVEKRGKYVPHQFQRGRQDNRNRHDPMELDATWKKDKPFQKKKKNSLSKEEMNRRREKQLCFECGLPGHQANTHRKGGKPWEGKKKQVYATGRNGYNEPNPVMEQRELCATNRMTRTEAHWIIGENRRRRTIKNLRGREPWPENYQTRKQPFQARVRLAVAEEAIRGVNERLDLLDRLSNPPEAPPAYEEPSNEEDTTLVGMESDSEEEGWNQSNDPLSSEEDRAD